MQLHVKIHGLQRYLRCLMCDSSISRWASRMDCCCVDSPVLEIVQTRASVTESSSFRTFPRLSTSPGVSGEPAQLSVPIRQKQTSRIQKWEAEPKLLLNLLVSDQTTILRHKRAALGCDHRAVHKCCWTNLKVCFLCPLWHMFMYKQMINLL